MERHAFELLGAMEKSWWYRGRSHIVSRLLARYTHAMGDILDYGCGNGGMYSMLREHGQNVFGFEPDDSARTQAHARGYTQMFSNESEALARTYGVILFCDVLEHVQNDVDVLNRAVKSLSTGGVVIVTVPAYQWMWSVHDEQHHHYRRYTRSRTRALLTDAKLCVIYVGHWNMCLFLPAVLMRLMGRTGETGLLLPPFLNGLVFAMIRIESLLMRIISLPFGLSVVAVGVRK